MILILTEQTGYLGEVTSTGEISGNIPQYISIDNGESYLPVTSLRDTFNGITSLKTMPDIPNTTLRMHCTFERCTSLNKITQIPKGVKNMTYTFCQTAIKETTNFPESLQNISGAFNYCTELISCNYNIPVNVENISLLFSNCTNLETVGNIESTKLTNMNMAYYFCRKLKKGPEVIPKTVKIMQQTFQECNLLNGTMKIYCDPQTYGNAFWNAASNENCNLNVIVRNENIRDKLYSSSKWSNANINYVIEE